ncbi:carbohydrate ABC transporter permease [uncultured Acetatifactor sp.]|uniref:carbohydrate ABC transporter permease n=1 Tax=uncultured Acetatifactor sp. TaxID=1671927 RepID=UPI00272CF281|nr:carbohydrate ABC transporter permease [uncultured Acetatifactor sp.]
MQDKKEKQKYDSKRVRNGSLVFDIFNYVFLGTAAIVCLLPIINVLAISFSSSAKASAGLVGLVPLEFNLQSYKYALTKPQFLTSFLTSVERVILGLVINMTCTVLTAYPLSKSSRELKGRNIYAWFMFITMIFSGGLIPQFMVVNQLKLMNTVWALILPGAVPVFNVIILMNFFKQIPKEIQESAMMDGAGHLRILAQLYLPLSLPSLATITLFTVVGHWNEWFAGMIYMTDPANYPLQTYLQSIIVVRDTALLATASKETLEMMSTVSDRTLKSAQIFIAAAPILAVYPFVQKYFMKGLTVGSVKG